mmetsp:Transcript_1096/g.4896  ORF Transcript_1096/g.4896 Transcript_1096/m.4896 type:complete len:317 (+) Transcript_1096:122-1072(+)
MLLCTAFVHVVATFTVFRLTPGPVGSTLGVESLAELGGQADHVPQTHQPQLKPLLHGADAQKRRRLVLTTRRETPGQRLGGLRQGPAQRVRVDVLVQRDASGELVQEHHQLHVVGGPRCSVRAHLVDGLHRGLRYLVRHLLDQLDQHGHQRRILLCLDLRESIAQIVRHDDTQVRARDQVIVVVLQVPHRREGVAVLDPRREDADTSSAHDCDVEASVRERVAFRDLHLGPETLHAPRAAVVLDHAEPSVTLQRPSDQQPVPRLEDVELHLLVGEHLGHDEYREQSLPRVGGAVRAQGSRRLLRRALAPRGECRRE